MTQTAMLHKKFVKKLVSSTVCESLYTNGRDVSLINFYKIKNFRETLPDIWFDWETRLNARVMK